jgi:hypothetical protein
MKYGNVSILTNTVAIFIRFVTHTAVSRIIFRAIQQGGLLSTRIRPNGIHASQRTLDVIHVTLINVW